MKRYTAGQILLMSVPFTSFAEGKRRPVLVVADTGDEDIVVARVTSQSGKSAFDVVVVDWQQAGLLLPSVVRVHNLATLEKGLVERELGALTADDWASIRKKVRQLLR